MRNLDLLSIRIYSLGSGVLILDVPIGITRATALRRRRIHDGGKGVRSLCGCLKLVSLASLGVGAPLLIRAAALHAAPRSRCRTAGPASRRAAGPPPPLASAAHSPTPATAADTAPATRSATLALYHLRACAARGSTIASPQPEARASPAGHCAPRSDRPSGSAHPSVLDTAVSSRRFLRHAAVRTKQQRAGKVVRLSSTRITWGEIGVKSQQHLLW